MLQKYYNLSRNQKNKYCFMSRSFAYSVLLRNFALRNFTQ